MTEITPKTRKLAAGVAAVVLTVAAGGAAAAVNLGAGTDVDSPAGKLSATEPISVTDPSAPAPPPSTIYVDLTVPVTAPPGTAPATPATPTTPPTAGSGGTVPVAPSPPATVTGRNDDDSSYDDDHDDDDSYEDDDHDDDDSYEDDHHEEGSDDDD